MTGSPNDQGAAESLPEEEREGDARRPRVITMAFWLLIAATVLWMSVVGGGDPAGIQPDTQILTVYLVFAVRIRRSRWKARVAVTAAAVWLCVVLGARARGFTAPEYPYGREYAMLDIMAVFLAGTGVALLYGRRGNTYFRRRPR
ncbi:MULTISPECIES: hypothetical protein [Streptomyces]|uniref:hypothetical protein n=1 Tax=Streptomyces TaxID=1883 RepID=UPI00018528E7|nr:MULTISPECIES: hypothetical protein [Streptomyces]MYT10667.1 hypothetical protein [Streptomyces sp. SID5470]